MILEDASIGFAAVGSAPRLQVLKLLVRSGPKGLTIGEIQTRTGIPASTLSHHLRSLAEGGVIRQLRQGRAVINMAEFDRLRELADYLLTECCADASAELHEEHQHG